MPRHTPNIAVELRADVVKLVKNGNQFFAKAVVEKSGQIERENVENLLFAVEESFDGPLSSSAGGSQRTLLESHGSELGLQSMTHAPPRLCECDRNLIHEDVLKFRNAMRDIFAQPSHGLREIKLRERRHLVRESFLKRAPYRQSC